MFYLCTGLQIYVFPLCRGRKKIFCANHANCWRLRNSEDTKLIRNPRNPGYYTNPLQCVVRRSYGYWNESLQHFRNASPSGTIFFSPLLSAGSPAHPSSSPATEATSPGTSRQPSSHHSIQQQQQPQQKQPTSTLNATLLASSFSAPGGHG